AELKFIAVLNRYMRELSAGSGTQVNARSGPFGKLEMSRHEVGVDMSLDNVADLPFLASRRFEIDIHIALGIDDGCNALRRNHVRRVGEAAQIESLHLYRFHVLTPGLVLYLVPPLLRLRYDPQIRQDRLPAGRVFLLRFVIGDRRHDDYVV